MADILSLLKGIGYDPRVNHSSKRDIDARRRMLQGVGVSPNPTPVPAVNTAPVPVVSQLGSADMGDGGGGGIKGALGGLFHNIIDVVDTPRAAVDSAINEGIDTVIGSRIGNFIDRDIMGRSEQERADRMAGRSTGSFKDFLTQTRDNIGFQDVLKNQGVPGGWQRTLGGLAGDILTDPLTYVTLGESSLARGGMAVDEAAHVALEAAVRNGGRNEIATQVARNAAKAEMAGAKVDQLVANAGRRGAGALTKRQLERVGLQADELEKLGITRLTKKAGAFGGKVAVPHSSGYADLVEGLKGGAKAYLGDTKAAAMVRRLRISDSLGERKLTDIIRTVSNDPEKRADAVRALATINTAKNEAYGWLTVKQHVLGKSDVGKSFRRMSEGDAAAFTHALEDGEDMLGGQVRKFYDEIHAELTAAGVNVGHIDNYVPHVTTQDARIAGRTDDEVRQAIENLRSTETFQRTRTLGPGSQFLGETLQAGTIKEMNDIALAKKGFKFFEDDIRDLTSWYLSDATDALMRATQIKELRTLGVAEDALKPFKVRQELSADELEEVSRLETKVKELKNAELVKVGESNVLRRDELKQAKAALRDRRTQLAGDLDKIETHIRDLEYAKKRAETILVGRQKNLELRTAERDQWLAQVRKERGPARKVALRKLDKAEKALKIATEEADNATSKLDQIMTRYKVPYRSSKVRGYQAEMERLTALQADAQTNAMSLAKQAEDLKLSVNPPGSGPLASDVRLARANDDIQRATEREVNAASDLQAATSVLNFAIADHRVVVERFNKEVEKINEVLKTINLPKPKDMPVSLKARRAMQVEMRDHVNLVKDILEKANDPASQVLARIEADAAIADMAAWRSHGQITNYQNMVDVLKEPKFQEHMKLQVKNGFAQVGDHWQIPGWLDQTLTIQAKMEDPKFFPELSTFLKKGENLWKGYAIMRPGFVVRNLYSSMGNVYLAEGSAAFDSMRRFSRFYRIFEKNPEGYLDEALTVFKDPETVSKMDAALKVISGSGGGLAPGEVKVGMLTGASANPLSADFLPIRATRHGSELVEHVVRGGHAFHVLERGGTPELALSTVNKWHFNYRDITDFDRAMKHVNPFWTFWSKNLALQAQVWTRYPEKLNRTYYNLDRNMGYGQEDDELVPDWLSQTGMRLGGDGDRYLQTGLPSITFQDDVSKFAEPSRLIGDTAPWLKLPFELAAGQQAFSGIPFKDSEESFSRNANGNYVGSPREAPSWAEIPGIQNILNGLGLTQTADDGTTTMTDRDQYVAESLLPPLGTANRLAPTQDGYKDRQGSSLLGWLGLSTREVTPQMRDAVRKYGG